MLGIAKTSEGYTQLSLLSAGKNYNAKDFFDRLSLSGLAKLFDADLFNQRLGEFLKSLFIEIALIISIGIVLVVFCSFWTGDFRFPFSRRLFLRFALRWAH